jgi:serine-type D-Ala-D-Ala carboxypeptidase (penicillin-binding protein 5/6)
MRLPSLAIVFALCVSTLLGTAPARAQARAYVISDSTTGFILEQSGATKKLPIASLTKIATAMVVLDWASQSKADLSQLATIPDNAAQLGAAQGVGFQPGDQCSLRDLLYAALMQSDNVAAEALADHVGRELGRRGGMSPGDVFVAQMNALARHLGMIRTRFVNPHGLDHLERTVPYSTAEDLARLTSYAMANSAFRFHVSQRERKITLTNPAGEPSAYLLRNTNELLGVDNIDGVKTGTTARAGQCLIISAARTSESRQEGEQHIITPRRLNVIVLGTTDRFNVGAGLMNRGWRVYEAWAAAGRPVKGWKAPR